MFELHSSVTLNKSDLHTIMVKEVKTQLKNMGGFSIKSWDCWNFLISSMIIASRNCGSHSIRLLLNKVGGGG